MRSRMRSRSAAAKAAAIIKNSFAAIAGYVAAQVEQVELDAPRLEVDDPDRVEVARTS